VKGGQLVIAAPRLDYCLDYLRLLPRFLPRRYRTSVLANIGPSSLAEHYALAGSLLLLAEAGDKNLGRQRSCHHRARVATISIIFD
jgi:hypothetical protein